MSSLTLGQTAQCRTCHGTGRVRAPAMSHADLRWRERENLRRRRAKLEPLPMPPSMVPCPTCHGAMVVPIKVADRSSPTPPDDPPGQLTAFDE